jgi:hypothetical protein
VVADRLIPCAISCGAILDHDFESGSMLRGAFAIPFAETSSSLCPYLRVKQTPLVRPLTSANDPKRTLIEPKSIGLEAID